MIALNRFVYNGFSSVDFDLIVDLAFDTDSGDSNSFLNRESISSESYRGDYKRTYAYKYTDTFNPTFTLIKNNFSEFTISEQRAVLSWLTSSSTPKFLTAYYDDSQVVSFEILGAPTDISIHKNGNHSTIGIVFTFDSSSPYAFSDIQTVTKTITTPQTFTITCNSDELDALVYPKITIAHGNSVVVQASEPMGDIEDRSKHIEGTVYSYTNNSVTNYYWIKDGYDLVDYVMATSYDANATYYVDNNGNKIQANPQPTSSNFSQETYYVPYVFDASKTYYVDNNGTKVSANPQPTASNFANGTYYIFVKDKLFDESTDDSGFSTTSVLIKNNTLNIESKIGKDTASETVVLDGANKVVSTNRSGGRIFGDDFNWQWMPLAPGNNEITITGNCTVTIEWREPRKIAEF